MRPLRIQADGYGERSRAFDRGLDLWADAQDLVRLTHQLTECSWVPMQPWSMRGLPSLIPY